MSEWFRPVCQSLAPENAAVISIICAVLALLVLALIVLGFGPLGVWFGLSSAGGSPLRHPASDDGGLLAMWRLYREMGRSHASHLASSMHAASAMVVVPADKGAGEEEVETLFTRLKQDTTAFRQLGAL